MITISTQFSKKHCEPGEYGSINASITLTKELSDLTRVEQEAAALYSLAEDAVNQQIQKVTSRPAPTTQIEAVTSPATTTPHQTPPTPIANRQTVSRPYSKTPRRTPAPISDAQLRYLDRLIQNRKASVESILQQYQVGSLRDLSGRDASHLIDELQSVKS